ncbi:cytochrome P450 6k1 isoform X2 [Acyrthosiphon pisum]|uniref:Cytochrome P450 n=1 Tax=Acyrthosiphon pisum TaxID=7029 RepID=A0A8R1ZZT4_ACYPI|nr:cytochrome P450 6k1 isoform X2 [Acyrthosiphon pisum]|eukprot:XP_001943150.2 PREDICTED: cytochrome P450 6k1-like isoform X2 [Acyrthosiphon pisum]
MISFLIDCLVNNVTCLSLIVIFTGSFYYYSTSTYNKWRKLKIPYVPPVPLFGNTFRMLARLEHPIDTFDKIYNHFPDFKLFGFYQMREPMLLVRDPELINMILVKDFLYFTDHGVDIDPSMSTLAKSLFFANGQKWRTMRQKLSPGFTSGKLKGTYCQINECSDEMVSSIVEAIGKKTDRIELKTITGRFSTDVIATCAFGLKLDSIKNGDSEFRRYVKILFQTTTKQAIILILSLICPRVVKILRLQFFSLEATNFFSKVFADVIKYREDHNVSRNDITQTLIEARKELVLKEISTTEDKFTDDDIIGNAIFLFSAGSETISSLVCFCLYELALNKEIQDKLRAEIYSMKAKHNGKLNNDYLVDLRYTNMVLEETGRKYSIAFNITRVATKTYTLPDESFVIEKGQKLIIPMFNIHRDPKYYPDPLRFDPERFSMEQKSQRPNGTYIPFGDGPRLCIGKRFAEAEMKLVLSKVLSKFEVQPCEQTEIPLDIRSGSGLLSPKNGLVLKFKPIIEH